MTLFAVIGIGAVLYGLYRVGFDEGRRHERIMARVNAGEIPRFNTED